VGDRGADSGSISLEIKPNHEVDRTQRGGYPSKGTFWAEVEIYHEGRDVWNARPTDIYRNKKRGAANGPWSQTTTGWFMVGYGPFRRLYGSSPEAQRLMVIPGRIPRFATLFKEDATLAEGEQWMMELQYKKLERQDGQAPALDGLIRLIGSEFLPHGVVIDHVGSEGIWLKDTDRSVLPLSDLSDGYRSALAMLVDIYRHMVDAYGPDIVRTDPSGAVLVDAPGVVLVDEIDAHLHPEWQREIGSWLQAHFPLVQFIVATHSPLVAASATDGRIYHLPKAGQGEPFRLSTEDYERLIASRADQILLSPAFGLPHTRSPRAVRARERHAELTSKRIAGALSDDEQEELSQLSLFATT